MKSFGRPALDIVMQLAEPDTSLLPALHCQYVYNSNAWTPLAVKEQKIIAEDDCYILGNYVHSTDNGRQPSLGATQFPLYLPWSPYLLVREVTK